ncbi:MAG: hypothetical protein H7Y86_21405 [Rhizobacter sp.]|nr:hypothetical protein [Ferruginibacter sp.]
MNWIKYIAIVCAALTLSNSTSAQLLKKLKEKAAKSLEEKKKSSDESGSDDNNSTSAAASNTTSSKSSNTKEPPIPPVNGKVVFSLGTDERVLYDETAIIANNSGVSYQFVVQNSKYEYFLIDNGNRTGPFKNPPIKSANAGTESNSGENDVSMGDKKDPVAIQYSKTISGKLYLVFNGKNYGPYDHVSKMVVSPDKKQFFAVVTIGGANAMTTKMGMGTIYMVNNAGLKQTAGDGGTSIAMKFYVSESFTHSMVTVMDQTSQKILTVTTSGKQTETSMADMYSGGENRNMVSDKGDIITIPSQSPTQILVNGNEAASFKVPIENINRLFITPDVSKSIYYTNGKLYKADGSEVSMSGILFPKVVTTGNVTSVYYFKVFKNESGVKDVYLCKKEI